MDITQLILDDHHEQRRLFAILEQVERSETGALSAIWDRLTAFLERDSRGALTWEVPVPWCVSLCPRHLTSTPAGR
jgi:hypothetical protein